MIYTQLHYSFLLILYFTELDFPSFVRNSFVRNNVVTFFYLSVISGSLENMVERGTESEKERKEEREGKRERKKKEAQLICVKGFYKN